MVNSSGQYGNDAIGWRPDIVLCYRSVLPSDRTGCQFENNQIMQINQTGGSWQTYWTNKVKAGLDASTAPTPGVWSYRNGFINPDPNVPIPWKPYP